MAAIAVAVRPNVLTAAASFAVAAGGAAALTLYRYVDVGMLGPLPNMYGPVWYAEKTNSLISMVIAAAATAALAILALRRHPAQNPH